MNNRYNNPDSQRFQRNSRSSRPMRGSERADYRSTRSDYDYIDRDESASREFEDSASGYGSGGYDYASQRGYGQGNYSPSNRQQDRHGQQGYSQARQRTDGYSEPDHGQGPAGYQGDTYGQGSSSLGRNSYAYEGSRNSQDREEFAGHRTGQSSYGQNYGQTGYHQSPFAGSSSIRNEESQGFRGKGPKGYKRSDERIREEVCEALSADPRIDATEIEVEVSEGIVTLSGTVEERRAKRFAEDVVEACSGVKDVKNDIRISASTNATGWGGGSTTEKSDKNEKSSGKSSSQSRGGLQ